MFLSHVIHSICFLDALSKKHIDVLKIMEIIPETRFFVLLLTPRLPYLKVPQGVVKVPQGVDCS